MRENSTTYFAPPFPDFHAEIHWQAADGDLVTTYKTYHGTHQGTFLGVAPTGRKIHFETVDAMRVRNGQITEHWGVANAPFEKCFDRGKLFDDHGAQLTLMRRDLKRAIDEEAPFALLVIDRVVNDLSKELNDRLFGRQRRTLLNDVSAIG